MIALRLKCPSIASLNNVIDYLDSLIDKFRVYEGYETAPEEVKQNLRLRGDIPEVIQMQLTKLGKDKVRVRESSLTELNDQLKMEQKK